MSRDTMYVISLIFVKGILVAWFFFLLLLFMFMCQFVWGVFCWCFSPLCLFGFVLVFSLFYALFCFFFFFFFFFFFAICFFFLVSFLLIFRFMIIVLSLSLVICFVLFSLILNLLLGNCLDSMLFLSILSKKKVIGQKVKKMALLRLCNVAYLR